MKARKGPLLALTSALMAATSSASAWENPLENPYLDEPLEVCDRGSFFVGGVPSTGITRLQRYREPLHHPRAPGLPSRASG